jgi:hypothetical protein
MLQLFQPHHLHDSKRLVAWANLELPRIRRESVTNKKEILNMSTATKQESVRIVMGDCKLLCFSPTGHRSIEGSKLDIRSLDDSWCKRPMSHTRTVKVKVRS